MILVEAAVETIDSALAAEHAGADRIELCANLDEGGTTPTQALITSVAERSKLRTFVMVRPRGGDFVYSDNEFAAMVRDIELIRALSIHGIVTGVLTSEAQVDVERTRILVQAAGSLPVTFHRAIDATVSIAAALEDAIEAGASRVLTSGGAATALEGTDVIAALVNQARKRISIVAGGGIREYNAREVIARTGVREVHARFVDEAQMRGLVGAVRRNS